MRLQLIAILSFIASASAFAAEGSVPCIFCEIAAGRVSANSIIYRDGSVVAFMDRAPRNPGHVLVVPIRHAEGIQDVPAPTLAHMAEVAQRVVHAIKRTDLKAEGFNLESNTGKVAGQSVFHLHLHVIPRYAGEPALVSPKPIAPVAEVEAVAAKLRTALQDMTDGIPPAP